MSTSVDQAFRQEYLDDVHHEFQRSGGYLRPAVRMEHGVVGSSTTFQKLGQGVATTKARNGEVTPMNTDHTPIPCTLEDFYAPEYYDKLDQAKTKVDLRKAYVKAGALALGRKVDEQIIDAMDGTSQSAITFTAGSVAAVENSLLTIVETVFGADVPNDGDVYALLSARAWAQSMKVESFSSADFVMADGMTFDKGLPTQMRWKDWLGIKWKLHTGLPTTGTGKGFVWHKSAVGYATGAHQGNVAENEAVTADIQWIGPRVAWFVNHCMSGGACLIDDIGVREITLANGTAIPTS